MTELEKAARMALEALEELQGICTDAPGGVEAITAWTPEAIAALNQALAQCHAAQTELGAVRWDLCKHCGHDMKEPCHHNANPNAARNCRWNREDTRVLGTGLVNNRPTPQQATPSTGNILTDAFKQMQALKQQATTEPNALTKLHDETHDWNDRLARLNRPATPTTRPAPTERKGEPVATVRTIRGVTIGYLETRLPDGTPLYTSPQVPEDTALLDYLDTLASRPAGSDLHCFGGRVVLYIRTGVGSQIQASGSGTARDAIRSAMIDAARKGE